jgi:hypothetical protein
MGSADLQEPAATRHQNSYTVRSSIREAARGVDVLWRHAKP